VLNEILVFAFCYSVAAFVWIAVLIQPDGLFAFFPPLVARWPEKIRHVIVGCEKCFAGQLSFWTYPLLVIFYFKVGYFPLAHFLVILFSIFFAAFIGKIYSRL